MVWWLITLVLTWSHPKIMALPFLNMYFQEVSFFNLLWPGGFSWDFRWVLFKPITMIDGWDTCCEIAIRRMSLDLTDDKSTLVQVMAWCRQATSHYLSQCWPSFLSPYDVTRPQWVKKSALDRVQSDNSELDCDNRQHKSEALAHTFRVFISHVCVTSVLCSCLEAHDIKI